MLAFIGMPGPVELTIIAVIAVLLFGSRLPSVAKSVGQSFSSFKKGLAEGKKDLAALEGEIQDLQADTAQSIKKASKEIEEEVNA